MTVKMIHNTKDYFLEQAITELRDSVAAYHGQEIFVGAFLDENKKVCDFNILAKGNEHMAPVIFEDAIKYDVVIHNHPSSVLRPSDADVEIASSLGNYKVGFYIVDNAYEHLNIIVAPVTKVELFPLEEKEILENFQPRGKIYEHFVDYEERSSQMEMIKGVVYAFNEDKVYVSEASTGTGKSMAYLVPAIKWIKENKEKVVISTKTINLQEQLIHKDIPALQNILNEDFSYALVKGRNNYLCRRKFGELKHEPLLWMEDFGDISNLSDGTQTKNDKIEELIEWGTKTTTGDKAELSFMPHTKVWDQIASEVDTCRRSKCPFQENCFYQKARKKVFTADVLVVNHHILCADISLKHKAGKYNSNALLPAYQRLVVDEAHDLEEVATHYLGQSASNGAIHRNLNLLARMNKKRDGVRGGVLDRLVIDLKKKGTIKDKNKWIEIEKDIQQFEKYRIQYHRSNRDLFHQLFEYIEGKAPGDYLEKKIRFKLGQEKDLEWQAKYQAPLLKLLTGLEKMSTLLKKIFQNCSDEINDQTYDQMLYELHAYLERIGEIIAVFNNTFKMDSGEEIKWISGKKSGEQISFSANVSPLYIGKELKEMLFDPLKTVVLTSATLKDGKDFSFFKNRTGLNLLKEDRVRCESLKPNFDYENNCSFYIPADLPLPHEQNFLVRASEHIAELISHFSGKTLILFTSYSQMLLLKEMIKDYCLDLGLTLLTQGQEPRSILIEKFKNEEKQVLLGVSSFWEGVDIKGDSLSCLVMMKLPFQVPTEPLYEARVEYLEKEGKNAFVEYSLPNAIIKFKQGFGRLIRSKTDKGMFCVFDKRVVQKFYGKQFMQSLPKLKHLSQFERSKI